MAAPMVTGATSISAEAIDEFLDYGIKMMQSEETRKMLKDPSVARPGQRLIELQRAGWDHLGIDRDLGCAQLDQLEKMYPGQPLLYVHRDEFIHAAQRSYLRALHDRRPTKLEKRKPMPRDVIVEFFDACNTLMDLPETHQRLMKHLHDTKQVPNELIIQMQRDQLEVLGFEQEHGCAMLSAIGKDFPTDKELHQRFEVWRRKAQMACMRVVKSHQMNGGEMPQQENFTASPELRDMKEKAREEIEAMTQQQRKELLERLQKKVQVFMSLPPDGKSSYMKKLSETDRLEFMKAQMIMFNIMQSQWKSQQHGAPHSHTHDTIQVAPGPAVATPQQQQMM